jgi:FixJ family two-component response regulator
VNDPPVIAIVDDDDSVRRSLLRVVQSAGYAAESFPSARAFLDWLPQGQAACLVLDVHMDGMSGFDLQDRLAVPIIFITAHDDAVTLERIEKSGASGHLRKPFGEKSVLEAIRRAVGPDAQAETPPTNTSATP